MPLINKSNGVCKLEYFSEDRKIWVQLSCRNCHCPLFIFKEGVICISCGGVRFLIEFHYRMIEVESVKVANFIRRINE